MALHVVGDNLKVEVFHDVHNFGGDGNSMKEHGRVVEVPEQITHFGYHSFGFDNSLMNDEWLAKPKKEKLDLFIGIVDLPVVVNRITELLLSVKEEDLKRNSITTMRMGVERSMTPSIVVKYEDGTEIIHSEVTQIIKFLESLKK